ncbi:hypothetical protein H1R20_g13629, partial [Candolleomyces eurysporus]
MKGKEAESTAATSGATTNPDSKIRHVSLRLVPDTPSGLEDWLRNALTSTTESDPVTRGPDSDAGNVFVNPSAQSLCEAARALSHVGTSFELISKHRKVTIPVDRPWYQHLRRNSYSPSWAQRAEGRDILLPTEA